MDWKQEPCRTGFTSVLLCKGWELCPLCFSTPAPYPIHNSKAVALRVTTKQGEWYGFSLPFLWVVSLLVSSFFTACFPSCGGSLVSKILMPGYFLIGVYAARRHFINATYSHNEVTGVWTFDCHSFSTLPYTSTLQNCTRPASWSCDSKVLGSFSASIWDVMLSHAYPKFLRLCLNLKYTVLTDKCALFPCFMHLLFCMVFL